MKRLWFIAILAASASACVEGNNAVQLVNAAPLGPDSCTPDSVVLTSGRLNYDASTAYTISFSIFSPIVSDETGASNSPAAFYAQEIIYSYESKNPKITFGEESQPIYFVVPTGAPSWIPLNLIGSEARKKLDAAVPSAPDVMTLLATIRIKGKLPSGKEVETNEVTFPIDLSRAGGCATGTVATVVTESGEPAGECAYAGQDKFFHDFACLPSGG